MKLQASIKVSTSLDPKRFDVILNKLDSFKSLKIQTTKSYWIGPRTSNITIRDSFETKSRSSAIRKVERIIASLGLHDVEVATFEVHTWEEE